MDKRCKDCKYKVYEKNDVNEAWGFCSCMDKELREITNKYRKELNKYSRNNPCVYVFNKAWKKMQIIDRIHLQLGWFKTNDYIVLSHCTNHIQELESYSWKDDKYEPEDRNDHTINASQYGFIPHINEIGIGG